MGVSGFVAKSMSLGVSGVQKVKGTTAMNVLVRIMPEGFGLKGLMTSSIP